MAGIYYDRLEQDFKEAGKAKIRRGEFYVHDIRDSRSYDLNLVSLNYVMKPGQTRHMSIKFLSPETTKTSTCPHCFFDNTVEGRGLITWYEAPLI